MISVDGRFKLIMYKVAGFYLYNDELYAKCVYQGESEFFDDFSNNGIRGDNIRCVELLLCMQAIQPVIVTGDDYKKFYKLETKEARKSN